MQYNKHNRKYSIINRWYLEQNNKEIIFDTDEEEVFLSCDPDKIEKVISVGQRQKKKPSHGRDNYGGWEKRKHEKTS